MILFWLYWWNRNVWWDFFFKLVVDLSVSEATVYSTKRAERPYFAHKFIINQSSCRLETLIRSLITAKETVLRIQPLLSLDTCSSFGSSLCSFYSRTNWNKSEKEREMPITLKMRHFYFRYYFSLRIGSDSTAIKPVTLRSLD